MSLAQALSNDPRFEFSVAFEGGFAFSRGHLLPHRGNRRGAKAIHHIVGGWAGHRPVAYNSGRRIRTFYSAFAVDDIEAYYLKFVLLVLKVLGEFIFRAKYPTLFVLSLKEVLITKHPAFAGRVERTNNGISAVEFDYNIPVGHFFRGNWVALLSIFEASRRRPAGDSPP